MALSAGSNITLEGTSRVKRWREILQLNRANVLAAGIEDMKLFIDSVSKICNEGNKRAGYGDVSLPEMLEEDGVKRVLTMMKIRPSDYIIRTVQILLSPTELPPPPTTTSSTTRAN